MYAQKVIDHLRVCNMRYANLPSASQSIGCHHQTLSKRLKGEGIKFRVLLDSERKRRCTMLLLENKKPSAALIAERCGFSSPVTVTASFQRWYGIHLYKFKRMA